MVADMTVIYYTHNRERNEFENKIMDNILRFKGDLPLISVSQKPINFGQNICVGEKPLCDSNGIKQLLVGLKAAKTKYAIAAESDTLYPPEYFDFVPTLDDQVFRYTNVYVQWQTHGKNKRFYRKYYVEGAQACNREFWIKKIEEDIGKDWNWEPQVIRLVFLTKDKYFWTGKNPVLIFKTGQGVRTKAPIIHGVPPLEDLPLWGNYKEVLRNYAIE